MYLIYFKQNIDFVPRSKAAVFLSYNECMRRMSYLFGKGRTDECSEECASGKI